MGASIDAVVHARVVAAQRGLSAHDISGRAGRTWESLGWPWSLRGSDAWRPPARIAAVSPLGGRHPVVAGSAIGHISR